MTLSSKWFLFAVVALAVVVFSVRNLPWHYEAYDEAKQAFTSIQMVEGGKWWYQETARGRSATKPPLQGWVAAGFHLVGVPWPVAFRLPPFLASLAILWGLYVWGNRLTARGGGLIALAAFAFNMLSLRLATLVRTDMALAAFTLGAGLLFLERIQAGQPWTAKHRWLLGVLLAFACFLKGPIIYVFVVPAMVAYLVTNRFRGRTLAPAWPGFLALLLPLLPFALWVGVGLKVNEAFYKEVVHDEFLQRFETGDEARYEPQPVYFYVTHLLHKWLPWSAALLILAGGWWKNRRSSAASAHSDQRLPVLSNETIWLICWILAGLVVMSLVPSKRPDRIYPVLPPMCLLISLTAMDWLRRAAAAPKPVRWAPAAVTGLVAFSAVAWSVYGALEIRRTVAENHTVLKQFCDQARPYLPADRGEWEIVRPKHESLSCYLEDPRPPVRSSSDTIREWNEGKLKAIIYHDEWMEKYGDRFDHLPKDVLSATSVLENTATYHLGVQP